jgi:hypothetical protein
MMRGAEQPSIGKKHSYVFHRCIRLDTKEDQAQPAPVRQRTGAGGPGADPADNVYLGAFTDEHYCGPAVT